MFYRSMHQHIHPPSSHRKTRRRHGVVRHRRAPQTLSLYLAQELKR